MRRIVLFALMALVALGMFGVATAVQDTRVVRYTVVLDRLPLGSRPIRIVQLSDTHGSWIDMPPVRLDRIVAQANALNPDLIVLTGDYIGGKAVDWPHIKLEKVLLPFARLKAPLGVYAVPGNHDTVYWTRWVFRKTPVHFLAGSWIDVGPMTIAGANDFTNMGAIAPETRATVAGASAAKPLILLAHEPNFFTWMPRSVDLLICGHTHGGQIVFPLLGGLRIDPFIDSHRRGLFREHGQAMVVSSGIGTSIVPVRIGVPPEIVEIMLVPPGYGRKSGTDK